jgi:hypothetical protein
VVGITGKDQVLITIDSGRNGVTSADTVEKAANAFVKTYMATKGDYVKAAKAANQVIADSVKQHKQNKGDHVVTKVVN